MSSERICAQLACGWMVLLCACATGEQGDHYARLRARLERSAAAGPAGDRDPLAGAAELSRGELVARVLDRNPGVDAAREAARAALARFPQDTAFADPVFGYGLRPQSLSSDQVEPGHDFELSQAVPFPGKLTLRGERALAEADAAAGALEVERVRLASLASIAFDRYWLAERALETNARQRDLIAQAHQVALARYASGKGSQQDALAAETEQAMLEHGAVELGSARTIAAERINALLRRSPQLEVPPAPRELETPPERPRDPAALVAQALEQRPELVAQRARVSAREADVALARREFLPDFTLRGGYDTSWQEAPLRPLVGLELNLPLQLERRRAALEEADARLAREQSRLRGLENRVGLQVSVAVERLHEARHLLDVSRDRLLPVARDREVAARAGFASGRTPFLELIEAERALRAAEQAVFEARGALSRREAELQRALGALAADPEVQR